MKRFLLAVAAVAFFLAAWFSYRIVIGSGMLREIQPHFAGTCRTVGNVIGAEDVTIDRTSGVAFLSADDRRATLAGRPQRGEIYTLDLRNPEARPVPRTRGIPEKFHPHGISLWRSPQGSLRLFAINHLTPVDHRVEVYDVEPEGLIHRESITYPELTSPNDLAAVGPREFYASNDRGYPEPGWRQTLEAYLQLPWASVSHFAEGRSRLVVEGLAFANGVNVSADGNTVYVAECLGRAIHFYERNRATGDLRWQRTVSLDSCPDNIEVDERGQLWVAAHPKLFNLLAHAADPEKLAPSQVLRIDPQSGLVEEVFLDSGKLISAASTAAVAGGQMVIGAIFDPKVVVCEGFSSAPPS